MSPSPRAHLPVTVALTVVGFAVRMAWALVIHAPPAWDGVLYERAARGMAQGLGYSCFMFGPLANPTVPTAYYPVGYPAYLAVFYAVLGVAPWVVALAGALPGAGTVALVHRLALRCASPMAAALAATAMALMPGSVMFSTTPMTETLWGFLLLTAVWSLVPRRTLTPLDLALAVLTLTAATYVRPQAVLLTPLLGVLAPGGVWARGLRALTVTALVLALVTPWTVRNCRALDGCALVSTNGGSNLAIGAVPRATGTYRVLTADDGCRGVVGEVARDRCWRAVAWRSIRRAPARWMSLAVTKVRHTVMYETFPVTYLQRSMPQRVTDGVVARVGRVLTLTWKALCIAALVALLPVYPRRPLGPTGWLCAGAFFGVVATHAMFFGGDRYHLPVTGFVAVIAAGALRGIPHRVRRTRQQ